MSIWRRSLIYLKTHKLRCILLMFTLTVIASGMMLGLAIWKGSQDGMQELQKAYGNSFTVKAIIPQNAEDKNLWEQTGDIPGFEQYRYKGLIVDDELIDKVMEVEGVTDVCKEAKSYLAYFPEVDLIDALLARLAELERETGEYSSDDPRIQNQISEKQNILQGCNNSELLSYFRTNTLELVEGRAIREGDKYQILISDELAEKNQLKVGDQIRVEQLSLPLTYTKRITDLNDLTVVATEYLTIAGIFHANVAQYTNEYTVEEQVIGNYMFMDIDGLTEMERISKKDLGEAIDPEYTATFFIDDPARMDEIIEEIKEIPEITWSDYELKVDTSMYESALKPLENVSKITTFLIVFLIAVCIVLLILVLRIWIGARKKEVGILLSIGETKRKIRGQMFLEGGIFLLGALILAVGITMWSGTRLGNGLLEHMNRQEEQNSKQEVMDFPTDINALEAYNEQFEIKSEAEAVEEISCQPDIEELAAASALLYVVLGAAVWLETRKILGNGARELLG